jgi:hypothetical protein
MRSDSKPESWTVSVPHLKLLSFTGIQPHILEIVAHDVLNGLTRRHRLINRHDVTTLLNLHFNYYYNELLLRLLLLLLLLLSLFLNFLRNLNNGYMCFHQRLLLPLNLYLNK